MLPAMARRDQYTPQVSVRQHVSARVDVWSAVCYHLKVDVESVPIPADTSSPCCHILSRVLMEAHHV